MEVRPGYKQTEVGVIPEDWDCVTLDSIGIFSKGQGIRKDEASTGDIPCVRYGELYTRHNNVVREFHSHISAEVAKTSKLVKKGDLLFAGSGETKEDIGRCAAVIYDFVVYAGSDIVIFSPKKGDSTFLGYLANAPQIARQKASLGQGDAVVHISASSLSSIRIGFPPIFEQRAIAAALSDVDALLAKLDQFIAKKRDLKQAAMQQLLTGQTRLPGFGGEWEVKRLGEIAKLYQPVTISARQFTESGYPVYGANGVVGFYAEFNHETCQVTITCRGSTCGTVNRTVEKSWITGNAMVVNCDHSNDLSKDFLYQLLLGQDLSVCITGTGQPQIVRGPLANFEMKIPLDLNEQTAIAIVLSDMDTELTALEARRDKTRALKQGMMQALLTGKIRLLAN